MSDRSAPGFETPVLLIVFNRPSTTARVFAAVREMRPRKLLVTADGPRTQAEAERCRATRAIFDGIDWDCELLTNYSDVNLRSPYACSQGISWAFDQVDRAIILEDDCLPDRAFFEFCELMLKRYADTPNVMHICGSNFIPERDYDASSYHFSRYASAWGWATWRRAWGRFDLELNEWPRKLREGLLEQEFSSAFERRYWRYFFSRVHDKQSVHWDYAWKFACLANGGRAVVPNVNLVSNIGFDADATHTKNPLSYVAGLPLESLDVDAIRHPQAIAVNEYADALTFTHRYRKDLRSRRQKFVAAARRSLRKAARAALDALPAHWRRPMVAALTGVWRSGRLWSARIVRLFSRPAMPANADGTLNIHLGCGAIDHPAFVNVDLLPFRHIHHIRRIDRLGVFADASADLIYACHCLEHIRFADLDAVLQEWRRVLKAGGILRISVPDFDRLLAIYENNGRDIATIIKPLFGGQDYRYNFHYNAFTEQQLSQSLLDAGFSTVRGWVPGSSILTSINDWSGRTLCVRGKDYPVSLNLEAVK